MERHSVAIQFRPSPPDNDGRPHLPLHRLPAKAEWVLGITCWELLQIDTHFMNRRTLPCLGTECSGCADQKPKRYEAYISGVRGSDKKHILLALTPGAARSILEGVPSPTQLRGHIITVARNGARINGTLRAVVSENMVSAERLPPAPDLIAHMLEIWGLDRSHIGQDAPSYAQGVEKHLRDQFNNNGS